MHYFALDAETTHEDTVFIPIVHSMPLEKILTNDDLDPELLSRAL